MASYSASKKIAEPTPKAPRVVMLPVDAWADDWKAKPKVPVEIGLRLISAADIEQARSEAARQAIDWYEDRDGSCIDETARDESYNDSLMRFAVARATCKPQDHKQPYFELAEETIRIALTIEGIRFLWDELILLHRGTGVNQSPIEAEEIPELAAILACSGSVDKLPEGVRGEIRRLLAHCLEKLREVAPLPAEQASDDDGAVVYEGRAE